MSTSKIFFSYSRMDSEFALRLAKDIRGAGEDIWIDQLDIQAGQHWDAAVEKALLGCSCVLVIISETSIASNNVKDEISFALETGKRIIPVRIEECAVPFRLHRLTHIDLYKNYEEGLTKLLATVKSPVKINTAAKLPQLVTSDGLSTEEEDLSVLPLPEDNDIMLWDKACHANSVEGFESYLRESVNGAFREEAKLMANHLKLEQKEAELELLLWQKAKTEQTREEYARYLKDHPNGRYKIQAETALAKLNEKTSVPVLNQVSEVKNPFLQKKFSEVKTEKKKISKTGFIIAGSVLLLALVIGFAMINNKPEDKDQLAWKQASEVMDQTSLMNYLKAFPNGKYSVTAKQILDSFNLAKQAESQVVEAEPIQAKPEEPVQQKPVAEPTTKKAAPNTPTDQTPKTNLKFAKPVVEVKEKVVSPYAIGQTFLGGTIVYIDGTGLHGLLVADRELGPVDYNTAVKKSASFKLNGYDDWRLPTKNELGLMYANRKALGLVAAGMYWSSSEAGETIHATQNLMDGHVGNYNNGMSCNVKVVKAF